MKCYNMTTKEFNRFPEKLVKLLFDVWDFVSPEFIPNIKDLLKICESHVTPVFVKQAFEKLQADSNSDKTCPDCNEVLPYLTKQDKKKFRTHQEKHEREKFSCDCHVTFEMDGIAKKKHILLNHSDGKYSKCKFCAYIGTTQQMSSHVKNNHKPHICDICGKKVPTKAALSVHILDHRTYQCTQCGIALVGRHKYTRHMDTNHTGQWPCQVRIIETRQVSSMIHSARPTVSPVGNIVFALFCFARF